MTTVSRTPTHCGAPYSLKGTHSMALRTLFGETHLRSPRFYTCPCLAMEAEPPERAEQQQGKSFSPLAIELPERTTPEFCYLQTKWSALMSYGLTARLLQDVLPLDKPLSTAVLSRQVRKVAQRVDGELGEEQTMFIEGCPQQWEQLPLPDAPLTVGIDGGYVHGRDGKNRKAGCFEVIVGKSMPQEGPNRRFGFVNGYDTKPKRRLFEVLKEQGMQENQQVIFLSDGGDTVRDLQLYLNPQAEHLLDWFHVAMRLTVLSQLAKSILVQEQGQARNNQNNRSRAKKEQKECNEERIEYPTPQETVEEIAKELERVKWFLWHGNAFRALEVLESLGFDLEVQAERSQARKKLGKAVEEFSGYIRANQAFIVNYGDRYRNGETIASAFVESTVNEVISKRMEKKQQMRWTKAGAHQVLQVRIQVLDGELGRTFERWYPGMRLVEQQTQVAA